MQRDILLLRLSYWLGAIIDGLVGAFMVVPFVFGLKEGIENFTPGPDYVYAMGVGASLMFGWTLLLIWADRKPIERKSILLITIPVVIGIYTSRIYGITSGFLSFEYSIPDLVIPIILCALFLVAYFTSNSDTE